MKKRINAGIIGMGFIGNLHLQGLRMLENVTIKSVATGSRQKADLIRDKYDVKKVTDDWRELIDDPEIQVIHNCTPNHLHDEINIAAIKAGKHIYSEKPLSLTAGEGYKIWKMAEAAGIAHGINYHYRMNAAVQEIKNRIQKGELGKPLFVSGCYLQESVAKRTDYTKRQIPETSPARAVLDIGTHWADTASVLLGQPVKKVHANMITHYPVRTDPLTGEMIFIHSDDTTSVQVEFADGTYGQALFSKCMIGHKNDLRVTVSGEKHEYAWEQQQDDRFFIGNRAKGNETVYMNRAYCCPETVPYITLPTGHVMGWREALVNAMNAFYESVRTGSYRVKKKDYATFEDGWRGNCFVEACIQSSKEKRWVSMEEIK